MGEEDKDFLKLEVTEEHKQIIRETILRVAAYIRKHHIAEGTLTKEATAGWNFACEFLSQELMNMRENQPQQGEEGAE